MFESDFVLGYVPVEECPFIVIDGMLLEKRNAHVSRIIEKMVRFGVDAEDANDALVAYESMGEIIINDKTQRVSFSSPARFN